MSKLQLSKITAQTQNNSRLSINGKDLKAEGPIISENSKRLIEKRLNDDFE
jgi:hypothetical protein